MSWYFWNVFHFKVLTGLPFNVSVSMYPQIRHFRPSECEGKKKKKKRKEKKRKKRYSRYSVCSVVRSLQDHRSLMCISNSYIYLTRFTASPLCAHLALGMMDFLQAELFKWRRTKRVVTRRERNRLDEHPYLRVVDDVGENINSLRLLIESQEFYIENLKGGKKIPKCLFKFWWEDEQQNWRFFLYKISIFRWC